MKWLTSLFFISCLLFTFAGLADSVRLDESELELEIFDFNVNTQLQLYESADVYYHKNRLLLPFNIVSSMLEINIIYDSLNQEVSGKYNDTTIHFDFNENYSALGQSTLISQIDDELFIDSETLAFILQAKITVSLADLAVNFESNEELFPIEKRINRSKQAKVKLPSQQQEKYDFLVEDQYRLYTPPKGRVYLTGRANNENEYLGVNIQTYNDILYHSAHLTVSDTSDNDLTARFNMTRQQTRPDKKILGLLNNYSFGDVAANNTRLQSGYAGLGVTFSSFDNRFSSYYGRTDIEELAPPEWQAELYQNGFLISTQTVPADGRLVFQQVDTNYGINRFEIKLYGPYGEEQTIEREIIIGQKMLQPGSFAFNGGIIDTSASLFNNPNTRDLDSSPAAFIQTEYGVNDKTSLGLSYFIQDTTDTADPNNNDTTLQEFIFNVSRQLPDALLDTTVFFQDSDKYRFDINVLGSFDNDIRYNAGIFNNENYLNRQSQQRFNSQKGYRAGLNARFGKYGFVLSGASRTDTFTPLEQEIKSQTDDLLFAVNIRVKRVTITNNLQYRYDSATANSKSVTNQLAGSMSLSPTVYLRTAANFNIDSTLDSSAEFDSIDTNLNWRQPENFFSTFGLRYDKDDNYRASANVSFNRKKYNLIFGASYNNQDRWQINAGISFNIDYNHRKGTFNIQNEYAASSSTLDLLTYVDNNKNAVYDEYDQALPNVRFGIKPYWHNVRSNRDGLAYLPGAGQNAPVRVYFDTSETTHPNLKPVNDNFRFFTHAGGVTTFDVPFNYNISVDGMIDDQTENSRANFVPLEILNKQNEVVHQQLTDMENYYFIEKMWPGEYKLRIASDYLKQKKLQAYPSEVAFTVNGSKAVLSLATITLKTKTKALTQKQTSFKSLRKGEFFTVQFGVYNDREYCNLRVQELKSIGIKDAFYSLQTKQCRVMAGEFTSRQDAVNYRVTIPKKVLTDGFVRVYTEIDNLYTISIKSAASEQECVNFVTETHMLASYIAKENGVCSVYVGDFLNADLAEQTRKKLPWKYRKDAKVVEY